MQWINEVDSLEILDGYVADSMGITKMPLKAKQMNEEILTASKKQFYYVSQKSNGGTFNQEIYGIWESYKEILDGSIKNEYAKNFKRIKQKSTKSKLDSLIINYTYSPVNTDGFKSIEFDSTLSNSILLLGDSFTFGHDVANSTQCFSDILLSQNIPVYNTGISGADIMQYYLIAKKYIPIVKPKFVIVNLFLGNDLTPYYRKPVAYLPMYYTTNASNLYTNIEGKNYSSPIQIYNKIITKYQVKPTSIIGKIMCSTNVGTRVWVNLNPPIWDVNKQETEEFVYVKELKEIEQICKLNGSKFILITIPEYRDFQLIDYKNYPSFFKHFQKVHEAPNLTIFDYVRDNGHFNEIGHKKYANFILSLIK
jgi:hypothetical protein